MNIIDVVKMKLYDPEVIRRERTRETEVPTSDYLYGFNDGYTQGWRDGRAALKEESKTRLIDTDEVIKAIDRHTFDTVEGLCLDEDITVILEELQTIQPKNGRWKEQAIESVKDSGIEEVQVARCSACGLYHTTPYMYYFSNYNFCPHCGARMVDEDDDNGTD